MANENITIEELAGMIKRSFNGVHKDFGEVHQRLDKLDENEKIIMKKLDGVVYRYEFEELIDRVKMLEGALANR